MSFKNQYLSPFNTLLIKLSARFIKSGNKDWEYLTIKAMNASDNNEWSLSYLPNNNKKQLKAAIYLLKSKFDIVLVNDASGNLIKI